MVSVEIFPRGLTAAHALAMWIFGLRFGFAMFTCVASRLTGADVRVDCILDHGLGVSLPGKISDPKLVDRRAASAAYAMATDVTIAVALTMLLACDDAHGRAFREG